MSYFPVLIPIVWAIVATGLGLLLFRSSEAVFERVQKSKSTKTKLRLVGSVTITAVVFYGLQRATPPEWLNRVPTGMQLVQSQDLAALRTAAYDADNLALEVQACIVTGSGDCSPKLEAMRQRSHSAAEIATRIMASDTAK
jgi:hypothetical protein